MEGRVEAVLLAPRYMTAPPVEAEVPVVPLAVGARVGRAGRRLALAWAGAGLFVFVPLLHFVLVPSLLLGGVVWAALSARATVRLAPSAELECPRCRAAMGAGGAVGWPVVLVCPGCGSSIAVSPAPRAA